MSCSICHLVKLFPPRVAQMLLQCWK